MLECCFRSSVFSCGSRLQPTETMTNEETKLVGIVLNIRGQRFELSIEEATTLRAELNRVLPSVTPLPSLPWQPFWTNPPYTKPVVTWSDRTSGSEPAKPFAEITCERLD